MVDQDAIEVGANVIHAITGLPGFITAIRKRVPTPIMFAVKWDDGAEGWYHPEQLSTPAALPTPAVVRLCEKCKRQLSPTVSWKLCKDCWWASKRGVASIRSPKTSPKYIKDMKRPHGQWKPKPQALDLVADHILSLNPRKQKNQNKVEKLRGRFPVV